MAEDRSTQEEVWKEVAGFPMYDVSNLGRVRSWCRHGPSKGARRDTPILKAINLNTHGYPALVLYNNGAERSMNVHRMVLEAFVGPCPDGMECRHGPGGRADSSLSNLSWGTPKQNQSEDRLRDCTDNRGERHGLHKLTREKVLGIRGLLATGMKHGPIAKRYGVATSTVSAIKCGVRWGWLQE